MTTSIFHYHHMKHITRRYAKILVALSLIQNSTHAASLSFDFLSSATGSNTTRMENDERYDQMTVSHNIQTTTSQYRVVSQVVISESLNSVVFSNFQIAAAGPISMSFNFDLGLMGQVPYTITINEMRIELPANTGPLPLQVDGMFSPYLGSQQNLTASYSYSGTIEILGGTSPFSFSDTTSLDIINGGFDLIAPGQIQLTMNGKFGGGQNTIFTGTHLGKEIEIGLINDHFYQLAGVSIPEPSSFFLAFGGLALVVGKRRRR